MTETQEATKACSNPKCTCESCSCGDSCTCGT